jgi:two-component system, OmpR family, alkaline phosphatase synthesis response regulator PhoP
MAKKILVIDDEENIRELIKFNLESVGYEVILAADGREGLKKLNPEIDLIVLDLMLPVIDGLSVCREIRSDKDKKGIPIIMLTAREEEVDKILGLEMGADDYMTKPFSPRELIARVKAILRRIQTDSEDLNNNNSVIHRGEIYLNPQRHEVKISGELLDLTPKEFDLLRYLLINLGKVLTRDLILEKIWGYEYFGDTRTVDVHIRRLRKKIGDKYIATVRGVGYKFVDME